MCCCLCPDFSPCWFAALKQLPPAHSSAAQSYTLIFFQDFIFFAGKQVLSGRDTHRSTVHVFALFIPLCIAPYKSYLGKQQSIYVCGTSFPFYIISLVHPKDSFSILALSNQSAFFLSETPNASKDIFLNAFSTDSFSRAHLVVGEALQTTHSVNVCSFSNCFCCLITKGSKVGKPNGVACNLSLTTREQLRDPRCPFFN